MCLKEKGQCELAFSFAVWNFYCYLFRPECIIRNENTYSIREVYDFEENT